ncbi:MAG: beta-propeller fold lactonase family protein [Deltaproteobacteria bacterium]|nr:beta-propeller fold lactonase family protein [Deltaproteobacteria bacterium]
MAKDAVAALRWSTPILWTLGLLLSPAISAAPLGPLALRGCVSETGAVGGCSNGVALAGALGVTVSPDSKHAYVVASILGSGGVTAFARDKATGALTQLAGAAGCVNETGAGGCTDGVAVSNACALAVSPDGKHVYVASCKSNAIAVFARDKKTGGLTQLAGIDGCVSETGTGGVCADGIALDDPIAVAVSRDGKHVYVASFFGDSIAVFGRNKKTGALTQLAGTAGCISETGTGGACADGIALDGADSVAVSADGKHVYVAAANSGAVAVFARTKATGALTQLAASAACVSDDGTSGACADGEALSGADAVALSADGKHAYVGAVASDSVAIFARNKKTGVLTQLPGTDGCVSETGSGGACIDGVGLDGPRSIAVSRSGKDLYVASSVGDAVAVFRRNKKTGTLAQLPGTDGCVSETGSGGDCADGVVLDGAHGVAVSAAGKHVYVASDVSGAVSAFGR